MDSTNAQHSSSVRTFSSTSTGGSSQECVCVCVSTPGPRVHYRHLTHRNFNHSFTRRGPAHDITTLANEASDVMGCGQRRLTVYLPETVAHAVQSSLFAFMVLHATSPQTGFSATFSSRAFLQLVAAVVHKPLVKTSSIDRTPHLTVEPFLSSRN